MDLFEHQGKELFARHGIPLVEGSVAESAEEARRIAERLGGRVAVKAQVQIGGRGKGGGIALVESAGEAEAAARKIFDAALQNSLVYHRCLNRFTKLRVKTDLLAYWGRDSQ